MKPTAPVLVALAAAPVVDGWLAQVTPFSVQAALLGTAPPALEPLLHEAGVARVVLHEQDVARRSFE
jgi:hypothetical protein